MSDLPEEGLSYGLSKITGLPEDELKDEADVPYIKRTLRRMMMTIANPRKAMAHVTYDADLLIIPIIILIIAAFSFVEPVIIWSKINAPENMTLAVPPSQSVNQTSYVDFGQFKTNIRDTSFSTTVVIFIISTTSSFIFLYILAKLYAWMRWGDEGRSKATLSGVFYVGIISVLMGLIWLALATATPPVSIDTQNFNNVTYINWYNGTLANMTIHSGNPILVNVSELFGNMSRYEGGLIAVVGGLNFTTPTPEVRLPYNAVLWGGGLAMGVNITEKANADALNGSTVIVISRLAQGETQRLNNSEWIDYGNVWYLEANGLLVEASPQSVLLYASMGFNQNRNYIIDIVMSWVLPYVTKIWQSFILIYLVKYNNNLNWPKSLLMVGIQQIILWFLFGA